MSKYPCSLDGCDRPKRRRGMCSLHYRRWVVANPDSPRCTEQGCDRALRSNGMCETHYGRARRADTSRPKCLIASCSRQIEAGSLCYPHYQTARRYKLPHADYIALDARQDEGCSICGEHSGRLVVDHNHETGAVRGLLCGTCNFMLGHAQDSADRLMAGAAYLMQYQDVLRRV